MSDSKPFKKKPLRDQPVSRLLPELIIWPKNQAMKAPQRNSPFLPRAVQVAEYICQLIRSGQWEERLPSERLMATQIGVSRDTVRAALRLLEEQGVVTERSREGTQIQKLPSSTSTEPFTVGILVLMKMEFTTYRTLAWVDELRRLLYQKQVPVEIYDGYARKPGFFRTIAARTHHDCWALIYPNHEALQWCLRNGVRAVVAGTVDNALGLPSVDIHYRALCHHAAGRMVSLGHRRIALLLHRREWGADKESAAGFLAGAAGHPDVAATVHYHNGTPAGLCALADRLLAMKERPTAWIIAVAPHFLTIMMHLQQRGVKIPQEISLISQDAEPWQHFALPEPTRYVANVSQLARVTAREIFRAIAGHPGPAKPQRMIPELVAGMTLGPAPNENRSVPRK